MILIVSGHSCQLKIVNPLTEKSERARLVAEKTHFIDTVFLQLPGINNEKSYKGAFWASELMLRTGDQAKKNLKYALTHFSIYSEDFKRSILQHIFTLYPTDFVRQTDSLILLELNEKRFAMMANYLIRQNIGSSENYIETMKQRFTDWEKNPILCGFATEHSTQLAISKGQIEDLVAFRKANKEPTIFVFVNKNRDLPGVAMIQNEQGEFLKENNDTLRIRLLACSITNLSGYLTNGNTPEGVFSM